MTTGERQMPIDGMERPSTKMAGQNHAETDQPPETSHPWYRRVSFWRSVAGMAIAIAIGCAAVALETSSELSMRRVAFYRHLELLGSRIARLRTEAADAKRDLAAMHAERSVRTSVNRVLSAPDVIVLRLAPSTGNNAHGLAAISKQEGAAIIEVAGLSATAGHASVMWWLLTRGAPVKAAEFAPGADGRISLAIQMPPRGAKIAGVIITLEREKSASEPGGRILLKGTLSRPQVLS